ncbi:unnamed protein product [Gadus morhua 'NCC']
MLKAVARQGHALDMQVIRGASSLFLRGKRTRIAAGRKPVRQRGSSGAGLPLYLCLVSDNNGYGDTLSAGTDNEHPKHPLEVHQKKISRT